MSDHAFATRAIHAGQAPDPTTGSIIPPIYQASTHVQDGIGGFRDGYEYNRAGNPTRTSRAERPVPVGGRRGGARRRA